MISSLCLLAVQIPMAFGVVDFTPDFTASEEYTDNLNLSNEDEEYEYITLLSPGATIDFRGRSANLALNYHPTYAIYDRFSENDGWRHLAGMEANAALGRRTNLQATDTFLLTEDPASETDTTLRRGRQTYYTNTADINLAHDFGPRDSFHIGYRYGLLENEDDTISDTQEHTPYLGFEYWILPNSFGVEAEGSYTRGLVDDNELENGENYKTAYGWLRLNKQITRHFIGFVQYTHIHQNYDEDTEDYQVYNPALGFEYEIDEDSRITLAVGYYIRDREVSGTEERASVVGDIVKTWTGRRTTFSISATSGYEESDVSAEQLGFTFFAGGDGRLEYLFTRSISGDLFAAHTRNEYLDTADDRIDNLTRAGAGIGWQVVSWLGTRLEYTYRTLNSTEEENEYQENRVFFQMTLRPESPFTFGR
jgi:hypothetical protein